MKTCTRCRKSLPYSEFWPDRRRKGGLISRCKACKRDYAREYRRRRPDIDHERYWRNPQGERERHLIRKYGVTQADYNAMLAKQNDSCAVCGRQQVRALDVDHCHDTGRVRGLLCTNCNRMIGHAGDLPERLEAGAQYLRMASSIG